jgi:hypothetical protein
MRFEASGRQECRPYKSFFIYEMQQLLQRLEKTKKPHESAKTKNESAIGKTNAQDIPYPLSRIPCYNRAR